MSRSPLLLALLVLTACDDGDSRRLGDDTAGEDAWNPCESTTTVVDFDEVTPLGFSAADLLAVVGGPRAEVLEWFTPEGDRGATTDLAIEVSWAGGEVRFVDSEVREGWDSGVWEDEAGASEPGTDGRDTAEPGPDDTGPSDTGGGGVLCPDSLEVDVAFAFATADGAFDETVDAFLYALDLEAGHLSAAAAYDDLAGVYEPTDPTILSEEWDYLGVVFSAEVSAAASEGSVGIEGNRDMGDGTAMAFMGVEAVWPPGREPW